MLGVHNLKGAVCGPNGRPNHIQHPTEGCGGRFKLRCGLWGGEITIKSGEEKTSLLKICLQRVLLLGQRDVLVFADTMWGDEWGMLYFGIVHWGVAR